jgi:hypothetical protein
MIGIGKATGLLAAVVPLALAACTQPWPDTQPPAQVAAAAPAPAKASASRGDAVAAARQCGRALGIAVRCNLLRDDRDFAVVRYAVVQGVSARYRTAATGNEIEELVDLATLDRLTTIGSCTIPPEDLDRVERGVRESIESCSQL